MICNSCGNNVDSANRFCPKCGAAIHYQPPPPTPPPQPPYGAPQSPMLGGPMAQPAKKSSCGKIILIILIVLLLIGGAIAAAIYFGYQFAEQKLKSSEPYMIAVKALKENQEVRDRLGEINDTGFPLGAYASNTDGTGDAAFTMSVQGTKGSGRYNVELRRRDSVWRLEKGVVQLDSGETIQVAESSTPSFPDFNSNTNSNTDTDAGTTTNTNRNSSRRAPISGGVLNGKAISLPKPAYPPLARQARASGTVFVQVEVDEQGNVTSARAVSGHPLLRASAEAAARQAKFSPTKLSGQPVKVQGVITYNFTAEP